MHGSKNVKCVSLGKSEELPSVGKASRSS